MKSRFCIFIFALICLFIIATQARPKPACRLLEYAISCPKEVTYTCSTKYSVFNPYGSPISRVKRLNHHLIHLIEKVVSMTRTPLPECKRSGPDEDVHISSIPVKVPLESVACWKPRIACFPSLTHHHKYSISRQSKAEPRGLSGEWLAL